MRFLVEITAGGLPDLAAAVAEATEGPLAGVEVDDEFEPVQRVTRRRPVPGAFEMSVAGREERADTTVFAVEADEDELQRLHDSQLVRAVYTDPEIRVLADCAPTPGSVGDVKALHETSSLTGTGASVELAVVDSGINLPHLKGKLGFTPTLHSAGSWTPPDVSTGAGAHPVDHGSMVAFDGLIAAPDVLLLDHALLLKPSAPLSGAITSFRRLLDRHRGRGMAPLPMVINNSWGVSDEDDHMAIGTADPSHPFNTQVSAMADWGIDVVFAAGNCGWECPDPRCKHGPDDASTIISTNSHPRVLCVGAVTASGDRIGYSSSGPGVLDHYKPDLVAMSEFVGSDAVKDSAGNPRPDSGTSAAAPVAAGVVAALRSGFGPTVVPVDQLRSILCRSATGQSSGFDYEIGWGILNAREAQDVLSDASFRTSIPPLLSTIQNTGNPFLDRHDVFLWQWRVAERFGFAITVDGLYGPESEMFCRQLQNAAGLPDTGIIDRDLWLHTWS